MISKLKKLQEDAEKELEEELAANKERSDAKWAFIDTLCRLNLYFKERLLGG